MKGKRNCTMFETIVSSPSTQKRSSIPVGIDCTPTNHIHRAFHRPPLFLLVIIATARQREALQNRAQQRLMNGKESRSTEYIRGWPSIDDANTDTSKGLSVSTLEEWKKIKNQKKQEARSTERKKKKRKKLEMERREGNIRNIGCIFSEENFQEKLKERDV